MTFSNKLMSISIRVFYACLYWFVWQYEWESQYIPFSFTLMNLLCFLSNFREIVEIKVKELLQHLKEIFQLELLKVLQDHQDKLVCIWFHLSILSSFNIIENVFGFFNKYIEIWGFVTYTFISKLLLYGKTA